MTTTKNETENKLTEASTSVSLSELRSLDRYLIRQLSFVFQNKILKEKINIQRSTDYDETEVRLYNSLARHTWVLEIIFPYCKTTS